MTIFIKVYIFLIFDLEIFQHNFLIHPKQGDTTNEVQGTRVKENEMTLEETGNPILKTETTDKTLLFFK